MIVGGPALGQMPCFPLRISGHILLELAMSTAEPGDLFCEERRKIPAPRKCVTLTFDESRGGP